METTMDTLMITIESASKDASKQVDNLITKLGQLQTALKNVSGQSKNLSNLSSSLKSVTSSSGVKSLGKDYGTLSEQLEKLGLNMKDLGDPIKVIETADSVTKKYKTSTGQLVEIFEKVPASGNKIKVTLTEVADSTKKNSSAFDLLQSKLSGTILKTKLFVSGLTGLTKGVVYFTQKAADYEESLNLFTVTMGDQAKQGVEWLEKFSNALYLDPTEVMQYMGSFNSLIKGLGTASDKAYLMSKNLTQLTYDLASFKNIKPEVAFQKLQSAISGEIEPLRNVGVALSENTLQELAYSLGLEANVRDLTEAQKAQLRYIQIMKSSTEWQTDMGRTLVTPATALRVLTQEFKMLSRAIGRVFIPIVMAAAPYVIALSQLLTDLANRLANLLGYKIADIDYSGLTKGLGDVSSGISAIGDSADKTKKKINTMLAPFDELNVVQEKVEKTGSGLGGLSGGDLGVDLPEYDALAKLTEDMDKNVERAKKNLKSLKPIILGIGLAFGTWKLGGAIGTLLGLFGVGKGAGKGVGKGATTKSVLPTWKTFLKGMGELATLVGGVVLFVEALGLLTRIPGFQDNITRGTDALVDTFTGVLKISVPLALLAGGSVIMGNIPYLTVLKGFGGLTTIIGGTVGLMSAIGLLLGNQYVKEFNASGIELVKNTFNGLSDAFLPLIGMTIVILKLGDVMTGTGNTGFATIGKGLLAFAEIIAGVGVVLTVVGGLYEIPHVSEFMKNGVEFLTNIGKAIGGFVGGIAGGIASGVVESVSSSLPVLGTNLSLFMGNAKPFFDGINSVDKNATEGIKNLANSLLLLTANNIIEGLTNWFTGGSSLAKFGEELKTFAPSFVSFANTVADINEDGLKNSGKVASALAKIVEVSRDIPNQGASVVSFFVGDNKLSTFGKELQSFAPNFVDYANKIAGVNNDGLAKSDGVFTALATIIDVSKNIPNQGPSVVSFFVGDNTLSTFGKEIAAFAPKFVSYYDNIKKVGNDVEEKTKQVFNSVKTINNISIDKKGGLFSGTISLTKFGDDLKNFGSRFKSYYNSVKDIKVDAVNSVTKALSSLVNTYKTVKDNKLTDTVKNFGIALQSSAQNIKSYFSTELSYSAGWSIGNSFGTGIGQAIKSAMKSKIGTTIKVKDGYDTVKSFTISAYKDGGFPSAADLFFANENGVPEMVGRIGNQTAVANQDQITTSITNALLQALNQYDFGNNQPNRIVVNIGGKKIYDGYGDYINSETDRYGTTTLNI